MKLGVPDIALSLWLFPAGSEEEERNGTPAGGSLMGSGTLEIKH
jgi:hypothetical protein